MKKVGGARTSAARLDMRWVRFRQYMSQVRGDVRNGSTVWAYYFCDACNLQVPF